MLLNKNIVLEIIDSNFIDDVINCCSDAVIQMDEGDLGECFDVDVEFADLDTVDAMRVEEYEDEEADGVLEIEGTLEMDVFVNGYVYWDGENIYMGDAELTLGFSFSFQTDLASGEKYGFEIEWEY